MPLTDPQRQLRDFMSDISEQAYCAGWLDGAEYRLWHFVVDSYDGGEWGQITMSLEIREQLGLLAAAVDGWIIFAADDGVRVEDWGNRFVPMDDWLPIYAAWYEKWSAARQRLSRFPRRYADFVARKT